MLQYFPTPYPDELWYSVLGRYHVRSGNPNSATTLRELFGVESVGGMGNFLPNCGIRRVAEKLPEGVLDEREVALNHTLFLPFSGLSNERKITGKGVKRKSEISNQAAEAIHIHGTEILSALYERGQGAIWRGLLACHPSDSLCDHMHETQVQTKDER